MTISDNYFRICAKMSQEFKNQYTVINVENNSDIKKSLFVNILL